MPELKEEDRCPNCGCWHGVPPLEHLQPDVPCEHNPNRACDLCGEPVGGLSMGGSHICNSCDCDSEHPMKVRLKRFKESIDQEIKHG